MHLLPKTCQKTWEAICFGSRVLRGAARGLHGGFAGCSAQVSAPRAQVRREHGAAADGQPAEGPRQRHLPDPGAAS